MPAEDNHKRNALARVVDGLCRMMETARRCLLRVSRPLRGKSHDTSFADLILVGIGGALGGSAKYLVTGDPLTTVLPHPIIVLPIIGILAAWVGLYIIAGTDVKPSPRRLAIAIVFGFAGIIVVEKAQESVGHHSSEPIAATSERIQEQLTRIESQLDKFSEFGEAPGDSSVESESVTLNYDQIASAVDDLLLACARGIAPEANNRARVHFTKATDLLAEAPPKHATTVITGIKKIQDGEVALHHSYYVRRRLELVKSRVQSRITSANFEAQGNPMGALSKEEIADARRANPEEDPPKENLQENPTPPATDRQGQVVANENQPNANAGADETTAPSEADRDSFSGFVRYANWREGFKWRDPLFKLAGTDAKNKEESPDALEQLLDPEIKSDGFKEKIVAFNKALEPPNSRGLEVTASKNVFLRSSQPSMQDGRIILAPATAYVSVDKNVFVREAYLINGDDGLYQIWFEVAVPPGSIGALSEISELPAVDPQRSSTPNPDLSNNP